MRLQATSRNLWRAQGGVAALEFALIAPVLVMLVFGILQYGVYFGVAHSVQQLTNDAARVAVGGLTSAERTQLVNDHIGRYGRDYGLVLAENVNVTVRDAQGEITVLARYDASYLPIFAMDGIAPMPPSTIENRASVRIGGF